MFSSKMNMLQFIQSISTRQQLIIQQPQPQLIIQQPQPQLITLMNPNQLLLNNIAYNLLPSHTPVSIPISHANQILTNSNHSNPQKNIQNLRCSITPTSQINSHKQLQIPPCSVHKTPKPSPIKREQISNKALQSCYCPNCCKHFKNQYNLLLHHDTCFNNNFPSCTFCGKEFIHRGNLKQHIKIHLKKKQCIYTSKNDDKNIQPQSRKSIKIHMKMTYKCSVCFKPFMKQCDMIIHKQIHKGERKYVCTICNTSYRLKSEQNSHMKKMHPMVWETIKHRF
eukprot:387200_1